MTIEVYDWARHFMWERLQESYPEMSLKDKWRGGRTEFQRMYGKQEPNAIDYAKANEKVSMMSCEFNSIPCELHGDRGEYIIEELNDLISTSKVVWNPSEVFEEEQPIKKVNNMYDDDFNVETEESKKRSYLRHRGYDVEHKLQNALSQQFGLADDDCPSTMGEMVKRIQEGKFLLKEDHKDKSFYGNVAAWLRWRDPSKKEDKDGYKIAMKALDTETKKVRDTIEIADPAEGLKALHQLEKWTYKQ